MQPGDLKEVLSQQKTQEHFCRAGLKAARKTLGRGEVVAFAKGALPRLFLSLTTRQKVFGLLARELARPVEEPLIHPLELSSVRYLVAPRFHQSLRRVQQDRASSLLFPW